MMITFHKVFESAVTEICAGSIKDSQKERSILLVGIRSVREYLGHGARIVWFKKNSPSGL